MTSLIDQVFEVNPEDLEETESGVQELGHDE